MRKSSKKIGFGSISLLLCVFGVLFALSFANKKCIGDSLLKFIGLKPWSNGNSGVHYTIFYSLIFFIPAFILGYKLKNNFGATLGKIISLFMVVFILASSLFIMQ